MDTDLTFHDKTRDVGLKETVKMGTKHSVSGNNWHVCLHGETGRDRLCTWLSVQEDINRCSRKHQFHGNEIIPNLEAGRSKRKWEFYKRVSLTHLTHVGSADIFPLFFSIILWYLIPYLRIILILGPLSQDHFYTWLYILGSFWCMALYLRATVVFDHLYQG